MRGVRCFCAFAVIGILILASSGAAFAESKRVLILYSFGREFKPWSDYATSIRAELARQSPWPLDIQEHSLVSARTSDEGAEKAFVEYLRMLFVGNKPDLIVSVGAPAAAFVQRYRQILFPITPMILTVVDQRRVRLSALTENDAVVAVAIDYAAAIENILRVLPKTRQVAVVVGSSPIEKFWREEIGRESKRFENRVAFIWYNELSFEEILKHAAALPAHSAIFWELMIVDAAGVTHEESRALTRLHDVANAPIFSYTDAFFGRDIVGGPHVPVAEAGQKVAEVAIRILGGEKAGDIKTPPVGMGQPKFDWREMQRWGISEARLPPGSTIYFRDPTAWEQYRAEIIAICTALLLQSALILWLLYEHRRRRNAEFESRRRMSELAHMNRHATVGELSSSIAHELNQPLGAILTNAEAAEMILSSRSPDLEEIKAILADIRRDDQRASQVIERLRTLLKRKVLQAEDIDVNALVREGLDLLSAEAGRRRITLSSALEPQALWVKADHIQIQQVLINLIMNGMDAMTDSAEGQRKIIASTVRHNGSAEISIADFGPGIPKEELDCVFDPFYTTKENGMGMGLSIARTIVEAHRGRIYAESEAGQGAVFRLSLPLASPQWE